MLAYAIGRLGVWGFAGIGLALVLAAVAASAIGRKRERDAQ
jgi:hypothetical protein